MDCIKIQTKVLDILEDQSDTSSSELFENILQGSLWLRIIEDRERYQKKLTNL